MKTANELREMLYEAAVRDLLGPVGGAHEVVSERNVRGRYLVGLLAPKGHSALPELFDEEVIEDGTEEQGVSEGRVPKASVSMLPSSIGLSFEVAEAAQALQVTVRWGRYQRVTIEEEQYRCKKGEGYYRVWQRTPIEGISEAIVLREGIMQKWTPHEEPHEEPRNVYLQGRMRRHESGWSVTLFLVNGQAEPKDEKDSAWLFQPEIIVEALDRTGQKAALLSKRALSKGTLSPEELTMAMLYRHEVEFAVGHGVAVQADSSPDEPNHAISLRTMVVPTVDVPQTTAPSAEEIPLLADLTIDMKVLLDLRDDAFAAHLAPLSNAYADWIATQQAQLNKPDLAEFRGVAQLALERCQNTLTRIQAGIQLLGNDKQAAQAFRFANSAMYLQRIHSIYAAQVRQGKLEVKLAHIDCPENRSWRVFQLSFVLQNLPALTDFAHPERSAADESALADLLWFPTGGGKTEAYLGVAAYAMAIRRLQGKIGGRDGGAGVCVLMRYTLRLLTLQQFQRAATLLAACETIRRDEPAQWGEEPFRLGLWVGRNTTPNWTKDADEAVKKLREDQNRKVGATPHQLSNCVWCGKPIESGKDIEVALPKQGAGRTITYCSDPLGRCPFSKRQAPNEGQPVIVVDEEIYRRLPTMLIATVDKFAQMPWNGRTAMLFGQVDGYCTRHGYRSPEIEDNNSHPANRRRGLAKAKTRATLPLRPPDLIIQDELHLISGPLGTLVGLYETAIDRLASWEVNGTLIKPKIIASTATIRRAQDQVHSLFLRQVNIFPPPGLSAKDNFFSRQREPSPDYPGRRYLGISAPGIRHKTALIRTYIAFLAAAKQLYDQYGADVDPWMTLVGYFNAMRELGGMRRAVDDSVSNRLRSMNRRGLARRYLSPYQVEELTSRKDATDIPQILDRLQLPFNEPKAKGQKKEKKGEKKRYPIDVLLATNMISVGVDVSRLGLMVVAAQPKSTAEYIQATSRVGRRHPGLVCTVYNWARPRDLSHYERFTHYHATFYQHVEALSVTPFSEGALQRGLSALLVSLVRLMGLEFNANDAAAKLTREHPYIEAAIEQITQRAIAIAGPGMQEAITQQLNARLDEWFSQITRTVRPAKLGYQQKKDGHTLGLLKNPSPTDWPLFTCPNSLRHVEPTVNLILNDHGMDRDDMVAWTSNR
ncbi:MAG: DISARM system helicase DrmA [Ardenticatenaceae bacterium]